MVKMYSTNKQISNKSQYGIDSRWWKPNMDDLLVDIDVELPEGGETVELCAVLGAQLLQVEAQLLVGHLHTTMFYSLQSNFLRCNYPES